MKGGVTSDHFLMLLFKKKLSGYSRFLKPNRSYGRVLDQKVTFRFLNMPGGDPPV